MPPVDGAGIRGFLDTLSPHFSHLAWPAPTSKLSFHYFQSLATRYTEHHMYSRKRKAVDEYFFERLIWYTTGQTRPDLSSQENPGNSPQDQACRKFLPNHYMECRRQGGIHGHDDQARPHR